MEEDQIIFIDKPVGISSFGVVAKVRANLRQEFGHKVKVGHTGTLDPFATGLLILLSGKMTKKSSNFLKLDKVYEATLKLGFVSSTGDPEGEIKRYITRAGDAAWGTPAPSPRGVGEDAAAGPARHVPSDLSHCEASEKEVYLVLSQFIGKIEQTPPRFSAIKVNGQRAYKLARKGTDFELPSRQVEIYSIDILDYHYPSLKIRAHVSSGTYIRTLAEDIGSALGTGAYLTALRRTKIGNYDVSSALPLSHFTK